MKTWIVKEVQGSSEWKAGRKTRRNASDLACAMGIDPNGRNRSELVKELALGIEREFSDYVQERVISPGHEIETAARIIIEYQIGEALYPVVLAGEQDGITLGASLDGITIDDSKTAEIKRRNVKLWDFVAAGVIPEGYQPQMEQGLWLSGADVCLFVVSDGTEEGTISCEYRSNPELRAKIIPTWKQLEEDVKNYQHVEVIPAAVATPQMSLPAVSIRVDGSIALVDNLGVFGNALTAYIERINKTPETDQDFANLEATEKTLKRAEDELEAAVNSAIGQVVSIDTMKRTAEMYRNMARDNRLLVGKLVKARKDQIKADRIQKAVESLHDHIGSLEDRLGGAWMPRISGGFSEAIKGLKTLTSIDDAISVAMANAKVEANAVADLIERNHKSVEDWTLVPDFGAICQKAPEDFSALIGMRKMQRAAAEEKRLEAERARIIAEERAKAEEQAKAFAESERERIRAEEQAKARAEQAERDVVAALEKEQQREKARQAEIAGAELLVRQQETLSAVVSDNDATITIGRINAVLGFNLTAIFLDQLGFKPHAIDKNAKLYLERDFPVICAALVRHIQACAMREAA